MSLLLSSSSQHVLIGEVQVVLSEHHASSSDQQAEVRILRVDYYLKFRITNIYMRWWLREDINMVAKRHAHTLEREKEIGNDDVIDFDD